MAAPTPSALSNYQLGDCLGKGAFGQVYRALNWTTGETVAIKQIQLSNFPKAELGEIMSEINLLKNLHHPRIVRYGGYVKTRECLYIILEYCENGSLASICKRYGKFPENLVAVYISQVLEGLQYLHDQGVCHRDIKAANILATKDGHVKLADFGVATQAALADNTVVGSPYWMAPEVIDQSGASTASDIWSVGCVVIELLEGKPPYSNLPQMSALWAIVQNDRMPIPEGASPIVKDFLDHCFQKDPNLRVSARKLLRHPWMRQQQSRGPEDQAGENKPPLSGGGGEAYDRAVRKVQEWNEALKSPPKTGRVARLPKVNVTPLPSLPSSPIRRPLRGKRSAQNLDSAPHLAANGRPLSVLENKRESVLLATQEEEEDNWDDDFAGTITFAKFEAMDHGTADLGKPSSSDDNTQTIRPARSPSGTPVRPPASPKMEPVLEDYSDLAPDEDDTAFSEKITSLKNAKGLFHPSDLKNLSLSSTTSQASAPPVPPTPTSPLTPLKSAPLPKPKDTSRAPPSRPSSLPPSLPPSRSPSRPSSPSQVPSPRTPEGWGSRRTSFRGASAAEPTEEQARRSSDLAKYEEREDEDFEDVFGKAPPAANGMSGQTLQLTTRLSNKSWLGDDFPDDEDPFAEIEDDFAEADLEANLLRDRHARLCAAVVQHIAELEPGAPDFELSQAADNLIAILNDYPEMMQQLVAAHGMLAILEVLEAKPAKDVIGKLLRIVNTIVAADPAVLESFCLVGGIAVVMAFASKRFSHQIRLEAATFVAHVSQTSVLTLQMFISCRGLKVLVDLLDEEAQDLVFEAVNGIGSVFELHSPTPKTDFCRIFAREGLLEPLSSALVNLLREHAPQAEQAKAQIAQIVLLFAQVAQGDGNVLRALGTRSILRRLLKACDKLESGLLVTLLKAFKHIATSPAMLEVLQNSNAIDVFVRVLEDHQDGPHGTEISSQILQIFFALTRLSPSRQEEAAQAGLIPQLVRIYEASSPLKQFALPILCDLAHAGKSCRALLWQHSGLRLYVCLLGDPYFQVSALEAILVWLQDETDRVEDFLLQTDSLEALLNLFISAKANSFESVLEPLIKICRISTGVALGIARSAFFRRLIDRLGHGKALVRLNLLRLMRAVCDVHPNRLALVEKFDLRSHVERLAKNDAAILVRELAKEVLSSFPAKPGGLPLTSSISRSVLRRTASETSVGPPPLLSGSHRPRRKLARQQIVDVFPNLDGLPSPTRKVSAAGSAPSGTRRDY